MTVYMITLNDYLYSGDTLLRILHNYSEDLRKDARKNKNEIDLAHCNFLLQITELLEHNDFLTAQSQKIREFYKYMAHEYPFLAFTFKGRIKSLIRAEEKFNGYIVEFIYDYYEEYDEDEDDDEDDDDFCYEVECPTCHDVIYLDDEMIDEGGIKCPNCGEELEFDLEGCEGCEGCGGSDDE